MNYMVFRSQALQSLALVKGKKGNDFPPKEWSKDDVEKWIRDEYLRHYPERTQEANNAKV